MAGIDTWKQFMTYFIIWPNNVFCLVLALFYHVRGQCYKACDRYNSIYRYSYTNLWTSLGYWYNVISFSRIKIDLKSEAENYSTRKKFIISRIKNKLKSFQIELEAPRRDMFICSDIKNHIFSNTRNKQKRMLLIKICMLSFYDTRQ